MSSAPELTLSDRARFIRDRLPPGGLFAGMDWHISPEPFALPTALVAELESLGRVLLQFNRAVNLLYRKSVEGKQPEWIARWLDQGKPPELVELQRDPAFRNEVPRVIRPDLLLTEAGASMTELDSVPGGIGLTAWLNWTYAQVQSPTSGVQGAGTRDQVARWSGGDVQGSKFKVQSHPGQLVGGAEGMLHGFEGIFGDARRVHLVVSEESATYRPEMEWLAERLGSSRFRVQGSEFDGFSAGDAVYRFFELFDLDHVPAARAMFDLARQKRVRVTPPPKPIFEEKLLFALLWNRNLRNFWRQELGESFFARLLKLVPYTWLVDPTPLPPHAAIPELNLTDWPQLKQLSQRERELILKFSGFSENAWGARGVYLGSDLSTADWSAAVDLALNSFTRSPFVLQRYHKPRLVPAQWFDFASGQPMAMEGRARLCPYYFVHGEGEAARADLGGVLATICPADKKIIHGMKDSILAPCARARE